MMTCVSLNPTQSDMALTLLLTTTAIYYVNAARPGLPAGPNPSHEVSVRGHGGLPFSSAGC